MEDVLFQLISLVVLSVSLGLVLGVLFTRGGYRRKLESVHREKEAEFKAEKTEISRELGAELARIRESIVQTVDAYEAAVQVLEDRLPNPEEQHLRLEVKVAAPLAVEYKQSRDGIPAAALGGRGGLRRVLQADEESSPSIAETRNDADVVSEFEEQVGESVEPSTPEVVSVSVVDSNEQASNGAGVNGHGEQVDSESLPSDLQEEMYSQTEPDEGFSTNGHDKRNELGKSHQ